MTKLATGKFAWFQCQRCGMRGRYIDSVADGDNPGLRVHAECRDVKNPQEEPFTAEDGIALRHPAPDLDTASNVTEVNPLLNSLPPLNGGSFGDSSSQYVGSGYVAADYVSGDI